jgi:poly(hydroxyalkanoate) granule-associated protein
MANKRSKNPTAAPADKAHAIWLAGLGAVSIAQKRGTQLLAGLATEGRSFQQRTQRLVREVGTDATVHVQGVIAPLRANVERRAARLGAGVQSAVAGLLGKLGIPSKADIEALSQRMAALSRQLKAAK